MTKSISTPNAPAAVGAYSQGIDAGEFVFLSGQVALTPNGEMVQDSITAETKQIMNNLEAVLKAAGCTFQNVVKTEIFLTDISTFSEVNEVYQSFMSEPYPARATVAVAALPKGARVEIAMVAKKG